MSPYLATLTDSFDTSLDKAGKWANTSTQTVWEAGQAKIPVTTSYHRLATSSAGSYDLTGSYIFAKVTCPASGNGGRETFMEVIRGGVSNDKLSMYVSGSTLTLTARRTLAGATSGQTSIPYDPVQHAWWRIRESGGTTYFDTSSNGVAWTNFWSVANGFAVTNIWVNITSGYWGSESAANTFIDNVNVVPTVPSFVGSAGNYNTTAAFTVTLPAFQPGDLAILVAGGDAPSDPVIATPAGWTFLGKTAATNMYSYIWSRVLQAGDTTVAINKVGAAAVGIWRNATLGTVGTFGIRSGTVTTVSAPDIAATGYRAHIFSDRSVAASAGEADTLPTALTYGTAREFYGGNPAISASTGICAVYFCDSVPGQSGANTATLKDSSTNAWGIQIDIGSGPPPDIGMAIKVSDGTQLKDSRLKVSTGTALYTPRGIKKVKPGYASVTAMLAQPKFYCGHRGGSRDFPEMSLYGYGQAVLRDYGMMELSLARTSDGVWFGLHDASLDRTSLNTGGGSGTTLVASSMTWAQVQGYQILGSMAANNPTQPNRPYMRFEELMEVYYASHIILVDLKYAYAFRNELFNKMDAMPGNSRERFVGKSFGVSGAADNSSGIAVDYKLRGYKTWGYFYEADQADFVTYAPRWDILGMDYTASQASWDALKAAAPGKPIMGHICPDEAAVATALTKGAKGFQVSSPINVRPPI